MPHYNLVVGVDQNYFDRWARTLLWSVHRHNPQLNLHCHIVNPTKENKMSNVDITEEHILFENETSKISYLQSVRFLIAADKFSSNEKIMTIDADTVCTRSYTHEEITSLFSKTHVLQHYKDQRWLAGLITFSNDQFRQDYAKEIRSKQTKDWEWGRDQNVLAKCSKQYNFTPAPRDWISIGKNGAESVFLTLKGNQKNKNRYLDIYKGYL